ncbi:MAG: 16S rRNA (uracil(1498)-N(3))-methyltransferase [Micavibrio aeruginosavorus]|uniref:Ribosomal RNA small subunit methyltransferase E n=1 Tax=Micavibrio aeruginosavorus TaxID=349221 RepID=A0A2W5PU23_9BACT|nr:MAG: 16S rRNA (uracil(1498)-N(3))-methyltransferase [Micavibrio aeruginosavorus]
MSDLAKSPRLYLDQTLSESMGVSIDGPAHHYLKNVMRAQEGDSIRLFNGRDGEFAVRIENAGKKTLQLTIEKKTRAQQNPARSLHLVFTPLKKERMDFLVEKAVELGATHLHPILTQNCDVRKINEERIHAQIIEATEQCERMDIAQLLPVEDLFKTLATWKKDVPFLAALERFEAQPLKPVHGDVAVLIGPAGGFTQDEKEKIAALQFVKPVSLGDRILRAETAALTALAVLNA